MRASTLQVLFHWAHRSSGLLCVFVLYKLNAMFRTLKKMLSVTLATALEGLQQPVMLLLTLTALVLTVLQPLVHLYAFGEGGRLTRDSGLAFMLMFGILIAVFTSGHTLAREIVRGTVATAIAKPISRTTFLLGKFFGALLVIAVFCWCSVFAILFAERSAERFIETQELMGYIRDTTCGLLAIAMPVLALALAAFLNWRRQLRLGVWFFILLSVFQPALFLFLGLLRRDGVWLGFSAYDFAMDFRVVSAAVLVVMLLVVFAALATALSTRLQTGPAVVASFIVLFLGFLADSQWGGSSGLLARIVYSIVPDIQHFWVVDALADGGRIPGTYVLHVGAYTLTYVVFILLLGMWSFESRDLG